MTGLLILIAAVFTGFGCYHLTCAFVDVPTAKTSRMMMLATVSCVDSLAQTRHLAL